MSDHDCFCLLASRLFQHIYINIILWNGYVYEYRYCAVLDHWCYGCWKTTGNSNNFITAVYTTVTKEWRSQCHKCDQVCGGTGVDQGAVTYTQIFCQFLLKFIGITAGSQPEFQGTVYQIDHFAVVIDSGRIWNAVPLFVFFLFMESIAVISYQIQDLFSCFCFCCMFKHIFIS